MTTKLYRVGQSEVTVRDPEAPPEYKKTRLRVEGRQRAVDGTLNVLAVTKKWVWDLVWIGLTSSQYTTLWTELDRQEQMTWNPPDEATTYTVVVDGDPAVEPSSFGRTTVRARLVEV